MLCYALIPKSEDRKKPSVRLYVNSTKKEGEREGGGNQQSGMIITMTA